MYLFNICTLLVLRFIVRALYTRCRCCSVKHIITRQILYFLILLLLLFCRLRSHESTERPEGCYHVQLFKAIAVNTNTPNPTRLVRCATMYRLENKLLRILTLYELFNVNGTQSIIRVLSKTSRMATCVDTIQCRYICLCDNKNNYYYYRLSTQ